MGWLFGKKRANLGLDTVESMAKIFRYSLTHSKKTLNHINPITNAELQQMLNDVFEEAEDDEMDEEEEFLTEPQDNQIVEDEKLNIEDIINLGPWVYIDNTNYSNTIDINSDDEGDWDPEEIGNNDNEN